MTVAQQYAFKVTPECFMQGMRGRGVMYKRSGGDGGRGNGIEPGRMIHLDLGPSCGTQKKIVITVSCTTTEVLSRDIRRHNDIGVEFDGLPTVSSIFGELRLYLFVSLVFCDIVLIALKVDLTHRWVFSRSHALFIALSIALRACRHTRL